MITKYKQTPIGRIPEDWEVVRLGDKNICEIRGNKSVNNVEKVAFIPMELISEQELLAKYEIRSREEIKSFTYCESGDLLLAKITPSLENGKQGIVPSHVPNGFALATTEVFPIVCKGIERLFLFYVLKHPKFRKILEHSMTGTTGRQRVSKIAVKRLQVPHPPLVEQHRIVEVLSSVDEAIQKVDEAIAKTKRLKRGLMQKLLKKGIGHKEFRDSPIGRFPQDWEYGKLVDFSMTTDNPVQTGPFGAQLHAFDYENEGVPLILIKNVIDGRIVDEDMPRIAETKASELARYRLKEGDIVFSRVGSVGRCAVIKEQQEGWLVSGQMLRVRLENPKIDNTFLSYAIASRWFQKTLASRTVGATRKSINTEILSNLPMVVPPFTEQQKIVKILSTIDKKSELDKKRKEKLERIKKGMMNDLLIGKRRVKVAM
jgi:type I restriction enzyme S subunit